MATDPPSFYLQKKSEKSCKNILRLWMLKTETLTQDDLRLFIKDITLFLQKHSNYNPKKMEPMFQRAYRLYVKYNVENEPTMDS